MKTAIKAFVHFAMTSMVTANALALPPCINLMTSFSKIGSASFNREFVDYSNAKGFLEKATQRAAYIEKLNARLASFDQNIEMGPKDAKVAWRLLADIAAGINRLPTDQELALMAARPYIKGLYELALNANDLNDSAAQALETAYMYLQAEASVIHFTKEKTFLKKVLRLLNGYKGVLQWAIPYHLKGLHTPTGEIFYKQWKNRDYEPTAQERQILKRYEGEDTFLEKREFMRAHPKWSTLRRWLGSSAKIFGWTNLALASILCWQMHRGMISASEYLSDPQYAPTSTQVQLMIDLVPMPHLALRSGDQVFSYEKKRLQIKSVAEFLSERQKTGVLSRSVEVITLNLKPDQLHNLNVELKRELGMRYRNSTITNGWALMIMHALQNNTDFKFSPLVDSYPSELNFYFSLMKASGDPRVAGIHQVTIGGSQMGYVNLVKDTTVNWFEGKLWLYFFLWHEGSDHYLKWTHGASDLKIYDSQIRAELTTLEQRAQALVDMDPQIRAFETEAQQMGASPATAEFRGRIERYFSLKISQIEQLIDSPGSDVMSVITEDHHKQLLLQKKASILRLKRP